MFKLSLWLRSAAALPWNFYVIRRWGVGIGRQIVGLNNLLNLLSCWRFRCRNHFPFFPWSWLLSLVIFVTLRAGCYFWDCIVCIIIALDTWTCTAETVSFLRYNWKICSNLNSFIQWWRWVWIWTIIIIKIILIFRFKHIFRSLSKSLLQFMLPQGVWKNLLVIKWKSRVFAVCWFNLALFLNYILVWTLRRINHSLQCLRICHELHMLSRLFDLIQLFLKLLDIAHQLFKHI